LELFNLALLGKWKWRFLTDSEAVWADLLRFRYGHLSTQLLSGTVSSGNPHSPIWWRDVVGAGRGIEDDWFKRNVGCCVGDGNNIGFWKFKWFGNQPFCELFPALFAKEAFKEAFVADRLRGREVAPLRSWQWNSPLSTSEVRKDSPNKFRRSESFFIVW
jgi:hypothetical protein